MKLVELMSAETIQALKDKYPNMLAQSHQIEVIPWDAAYNEGDRNPEIIEAVKELNAKYKADEITWDDYNKRVTEISTTYARKITGMAWIKKNCISFREDPPEQDLILHELGHIYFEVNDLLWNSTYGGGESLLQLTLKNQIIATEENIRHYHSLLNLIDSNPTEVHQKITTAIAPNIKVYPHLFPICLHAGYMPDFNYNEMHELGIELYNDLQSPLWAQLSVNRYHLFAFFQNLIDGIRFNDSFWINYAKWLNIIQ